MGRIWKALSRTGRAILERIGKEFRSIPAELRGNPWKLRSFVLNLAFLGILYGALRFGWGAAFPETIEVGSISVCLLGLRAFYPGDWRRSEKLAFLDIVKFSLAAFAILAGVRVAGLFPRGGGVPGAAALNASLGCVTLFGGASLAVQIWQRKIADEERAPRRGFWAVLLGCALIGAGLLFSSVRDRLMEPANRSLDIHAILRKEVYPRERIMARRLADKEREIAELDRRLAALEEEVGKLSGKKTAPTPAAR